MPEEQAAQGSSDPNGQVVDEFRARGGIVGGRFAGMPLLLLTAVGARSGRSRTVPLTYVADGERYIVSAGAGGGNPAWYHNVLANPAVTIEVGAVALDAVARVAVGVERADLFDRFLAEQPQLAEYQAAADRDVPMIVFTPVQSRPEHGPTPTPGPDRDSSAPTLAGEQQ